MKFNKLKLITPIIPSIACLALTTPTLAFTVPYDNTYIVNCDELQNVINDEVQDYARIFLSEDCSIDLNIPSGKEIDLYAYVNSGDILEKYTISNIKNDTITVENGATLNLHARVTNGTNGKAVIKNAGLTYVRGSLISTNGAYTVANSGEVNFGGLDSDTDPVHSGILFQNTGTIRIAQGTFDNTSAIEPYLIEGSTVDYETGIVTTPKSYLDSIITNLNSIEKIWEIERVAVGYNTTIKFNYPEYAAASGFKISSSDPSILEVTGSNAEGWTITAKKQGNAELLYSAITIAASSNLNVYNLATDNTSIITPYMSNYLANNLTDTQLSAIKNALDNNESISVKVTTKTLNEANIDEENKEKITKITNKDQILAYYDMELVVSGSESGKLFNIIDLGDQEDAVTTIHIPITSLANLDAIKNGYTRVFYVVRLHDGLAEKIQTTIDNEDLVFKSGKFSIYAIAYTDVPTSANTNNKADIINNSHRNNTEKASAEYPYAPETGTSSRSQDKTQFNLPIGISAILIIPIAVMIKKRKLKK